MSVLDPVWPAVPSPSVLVRGPVLSWALAPESPQQPWEEGAQLGLRPGGSWQGHAVSKPPAFRARLPSPIPTRSVTPADGQLLGTFGFVMLQTYKPKISVGGTKTPSWHGGQAGVCFRGHRGLLWHAWERCARLGDSERRVLSLQAARFATLGWLGCRP